MENINLEKNEEDVLGDEAEDGVSNHNKSKGESDQISKVNIEKYKDLGGLTMKKLNFGLWYLEHKKTLLYSLYIFLGIIGFVTWFSFFKTFGYYIFIGMNEDDKMILEMVQNPGVDHAQVLKTSAQAIQVKSADILLNSNGTYDIVAKISNINRKHYSNFSYNFEFGGETLGPFNNFILPQEEKYLIVLDQKLSRRPNSVNLNIGNNWNKLDGHIIKEWKPYADNYIDFTVENEIFYNPRESNLSEKLNLSVVEFDIKNNSAYSYYEVVLDIILYSRGKMVSVSQYPLEKFISGENRHINITWPGKVTRADSVVVLPNINIMADNVTFIP